MNRVNSRSCSAVLRWQHHKHCRAYYYYYYYHLTAGINFLTHFVSHVLICLFLIRLFSTIISPHQCHHHHSYHPSPHYSSIPNSKLSYFSNLTLHRHLAPLRTDFTDTWTALQFFSLFQFFLVFSYCYFLPDFRFSFSVSGLISPMPVCFLIYSF